jgi:hypothetical protein
MSERNWRDENRDYEPEQEPCCPHPSKRHYVYHASISGPYEAGCHDCDCHAEPEQKRGRR